MTNRYGRAEGRENMQLPTRLKAKLALAFIAIVTLPSRAQDFSSLTQSATEELAKLNIPGASIAVVRGDQVIFSKGFGQANLETAEPVRPEMLFRLGSTTKMFTAAALVGLLWRDGST